MDAFLQSLLALPTLVFTGLLGLSLLYWLLVIVGAADLDALDGVEGVAGKSEGALEGAVAAAKGGSSAVGELLSMLGLRQVPVTISLSLFSLMGWLTSIAVRQGLDPLLPTVASAGIATVAAVVVGLGATALLTRPLRGAFKNSERSAGRKLVGQTCRVTTTRVDAHSGQAEIDDGGGGLVLNVRCHSPNALSRGDSAVIIDVDVAEGLYVIEPLQALLPDAARGPLAPDAVRAPATVDNARPSERASEHEVKP